MPFDRAPASPCRDIAFDASGFDRTRFDGLNRYTGELLKVFPHGDRLRFYSADPNLENALPCAPTPAIAKIPYPNLHQNNFQSNLLRLLWHQTHLPLQILRNRHKLFYSPVFEGMLFPVCPQIITVHDVLPIRFPEVYPRVKYYFQYLLPRLIRASTAVITTSEFSKAELRSVYDCGDTPIHVVYQGYRRDRFNCKPRPDAAAVLQRHHLARFLLCVGETRPYKNLRLLLRAFARANLPDLDLAIVGTLNKRDRTLLDYPRELGCGDRVKFLGFVPDDDLAVLYRHAVAFCFPSRYEGFGIPPLEAMACGCPVLAARAAAIPEVCGDAASFADPDDAEDWVRGLSQLAADASLRQQLRQRGLDRVQSFRYREMGDRIFAILQNYLPGDLPTSS